MFFKFIFLAILFFNGLAVALDFKSEKKPINVEIVPKNGIFKSGDKLFFGIRFELKDGWKTYWKNPGDAGESLRIKWEDESNKTQVKIYFPFPERFLDNDLTTIGYDKTVIFPVQIVPENLEKINETLVLDYLICREVCIPYTETLNTNFDFKNILSSKEFSKFLKSVPKESNNDFKLKIKNSKKDYVFIEFEEKKGRQYDFFAFLEQANTKIVNEEGKSSFKIQIDEEISKITSPLLISITDGEKYEEVSLFLNNNKENNILFYLFLAFIGGFILNFMPCVLPVLSLKLYYFSSASNKNSTQIRNDCISIIFGIITSFIILAASILILKSLGQTVGWGFQFQNKYFLFFITTLILVFSLNLLGFFEIILPHSFQNKVAVYSTANNRFGHFLSGVFATLLATPCSAPFLGTAVGFSMLASNSLIFVIFLSVSVGFALPYLIFLIFPQIVSFLPKPGKWMLTFKYFLGILLFISSIWLMSLAGINNLIIFLTSLLIVSISFFKSKNFFNRIFLLSFLIFMFFFYIKDNKNFNNQTVWYDFDKQFLSESINSGKVVLVDVTADWCVTCKLNKFTTLDSKRLSNYIKKNNIVTIRGDWTKKDNKILEYIKEFGRYGIPVNTIYGPNNKNGILLPEILTNDIVIRELNRVAINEDKSE